MKLIGCGKKHRVLEVCIIDITKTIFYFYKKIIMKDLTNIPERFHILFNSDWNKANDSTMTSMSRSDINNLYLEYNRWNIQQVIAPKIIQEEQINVGFIKD
jgi:hypothetical protein